MGSELKNGFKCNTVIIRAVNETTLLEKRFYMDDPEMDDFYRRTATALAAGVFDVLEVIPEGKHPAFVLTAPPDEAV
jgi:hypothetical protein